MEQSTITRVSFRFDDPSPDSDHTLEAEILDRFQRYDMPVTVAVVPFTKSNPVRALEREDVPHLVQACASGRIEIALHGHRHLRTHKNLHGSPSEFSGLSLEEQIDLLHAGRGVLQQVFGESVAGFVPPWNTFDDNTLKAAAAAGMRYVGAGFGAKQALRARGLPLVVPKTCSMRPRELNQAIAEAKTFAPLRPWIVFVFHPDNFVEFREVPAEGEADSWLSLPLLDTMLRRLSEEQGIEVVTLGSATSDQDIGHGFWNPAELHWIGRYSHRVRRLIPTHIMFPGSRWSGLRKVFLRGSLGRAASVSPSTVPD